MRNQPGWPCCREPDDKDLEELFHRIHWRSADAGAWLAAPAVGRFSDSISTLRFLRPAWTHPAGFGGLPPATIVASVAMGEPGLVARADFDEDAAVCSIRLAWPRAGRVTLVMFDDEGEEVGRRELGTATTQSFQTLLFGAKGPIRSVEVRAAMPAGAGARVDRRRAGGRARVRSTRSPTSGCATTSTSSSPARPATGERPAGRAASRARASSRCCPTTSTRSR